MTMRKDAVFSNAVAKADEKSLLTSEALLRLSVADFNDAVKMLHDYGYIEDSTGETFDIDRFISRQVNALIEYVKEYSPCREVEDFLLAPYLFNNIKAEYKRKKGGAKTLLYELNGAECVYEGDYTDLDPVIASALNRLDEEDVGSAEIDRVLTKAMYEYKLKKAKKSAYGLLKRYVKAEIDLINIMTAKRAKQLGLSDDARSKLFIEGGNIGKDDISGELPKEYEELDLKDVTKLETQADNLLLNIAVSQSSDMDSVCPLMGYVLRRSAEFKTVKMILVCIKSGARKEIPLRIRGPV